MQSHLAAAGECQSAFWSCCAAARRALSPQLTQAASRGICFACAHAHNSAQHLWSGTRLSLECMCINPSRGGQGHCQSGGVH